MSSPRARVAVPAWSTPREAVALIVRGVTFRTASRLALVVGTLLSIVNQGAVIASGDATLVTVARLIVNYVVPFSVASTGYLAPFRRVDPSASSEPDRRS